MTDNQLPDTTPIATHAPTTVAALDARDPNAGGASHTYCIQYGGPAARQVIQFQHGARGEAGSTAGVFDDDLLAIAEDRLACFQAGPFACEENAEALRYVRLARKALAQRSAGRMRAGTLGKNQK